MRRTFLALLFALVCLTAFHAPASGQEVRRPVAIVSATGSPHDVVWANLTSATVAGGNQLTMTTGGWGGGASSAELLSNGVAGSVKITVTLAGENSPVARQRMIGLGTTNTGGGFSRIEFAVYIQPSTGSGGDIQPSASGSIGAAVDTYTQGDEIEIAKSAGGTVTIKKNGSVVYTFGSTASTDLYANGACFNNTAYLENVTLSAAFH